MMYVQAEQDSRHYVCVGLGLAYGVSKLGQLGRESLPIKLACDDQYRTPAMKHRELQYTSADK